MATGPDPNRNFDTDRELSGDEQRKGAGLGNPDSTRFGLPSWASALLAVLVVVLVLALVL